MSEDLFEKILDKYSEELELEVLCIVDLYNKYKIIDTNIDCGIITPKMMLSKLKFKNIFIKRVTALFNKNGLEVEFKNEPYVFKYRIIFPVKIVDKIQENEIKTKNEIINKKKKYYYFISEHDYYNDYSLVVSENFKTEPVNPSKNLDKIIEERERGEREEREEREKNIFNKMLNYFK